MSPREKESIFCCPRCRLLHRTEVKRCRHCGEPSPRPLRALLVSKRKWRLQRRGSRHRSLRIVDLLFIALLVLTPFEMDRRDPSYTLPVLFALLGAWALLRLVHALVVRYRWIAVESAPTSSDVDRGEGQGAPAFVGVAQRSKETVQARLADRRCLVNEVWLAPCAGRSRLRLRRSEAVPFIVDDGNEIWIVEGSVRLAGSPTSSEAGADASSVLGVELAAPWTDDVMLHELSLESRDRVALSGGRRRRVQADARVRKKRDDAMVTVVQGVAGDPVWVRLQKKGGPAG